jgi:hypothetical protein
VSLSDASPPPPPTALPQEAEAEREAARARVLAKRRASTGALPDNARAPEDAAAGGGEDGADQTGQTGQIGKSADASAELLGPLVGGAPAAGAQDAMSLEELKQNFQARMNEVTPTVSSPRFTACIAFSTFLACGPPRAPSARCCCCTSNESSLHFVSWLCTRNVQSTLGGGVRRHVSKCCRTSTASAR